MTFSRRYPVRFRDTDAAGVVYFAHGLALCHAAYEDSLQATGLDLQGFFSPAAPLVYPIIHASMDYRRPLHCGQWVVITLRPKRLDEASFEIAYGLSLAADPPCIAAEALTRHVCIEAQTRRRHPLANEMEQWLQIWETAGESAFGESAFE
ncbi:MAG: thioesterase family protein [Leptolyngbya sp.]|nr:thioesterase family protein [Leptolyngbya sp.]